MKGRGSAGALTGVWYVEFLCDNAASSETQATHLKVSVRACDYSYAADPVLKHAKGKEVNAALVEAKRRDKLLESLEAIPHTCAARQTEMHGDVPAPTPLPDLRQIVTKYVRRFHEENFSRPACFVCGRRTFRLWGQYERMTVDTIPNLDRLRRTADEADETATVHKGCGPLNGHGVYGEGIVCLHGVQISQQCEECDVDQPKVQHVEGCHQCMLELRRKPKISGGKADEALIGAMDVDVGTDGEPPSLPDDVVCRPPTFSALRRFDLGEVDLPELTWFEELALSLYHTKTYIVTVGPRSKDGQTVVGKNRVRAIMGHTLAFEQDPDQLMAHLTASDDPGPLDSFPIPASSLSKLVSVYFLGPPTQLGCV